jgi:hypothetical protein
MSWCLPAVAAKSETEDSAPHVLLSPERRRRAYHFAKLVIKFINNIGGTLEGTRR